MADGVEITAGAGTKIATDDTGSSGHVQLFKLAQSSNGSSTLVLADADGLLVKVSNTDTLATASNQTTIIGHLDGVEGLLTTIDADTSALAGAVSGTELQVDIVSAPTITVADGGSSLTVDGTVAATQSGSWTVTANAGTGPFPVSDNGGSLTVDGSVAITGTVTVDGSGVTQPVSGTVTVQDGGSSITVDGSVSATQSGAWSITDISGTVSLPTGAATSSNQSTIIGHLDGVEGLLATIDADTGAIAGAIAGTEMQVDIVSAPTITVSDGGSSLTVDGTVGVSGTVTVDGSGVTQPVSGTVTVQDGGSSLTVDGTVSANQSGTWSITDVSGTVSLPTGASTAANQTTIIGHLDGVEGLLTTIDADTSALAGAVSGTELQVDIVSAPTITVADGGSSLTVDGTVAATQSGSWAITDVSGTISLPTGAATSANQTTIIGHLDGVEGLLTTIDADTGAIAAAVSGTELQVDIVSAPTINVADGGSSLTVDGTVAATQSGAWTVTANAGTGPFPVSDNNGSLTVDGTVGISGTVTVDGSGVTQPVSGTVTVQDGGNSLTVDGSVSATQSGSWSIANVTGTVSLPTGASTSANQSTIIGHLDGVEGLLTTIDADTGAIASATAKSGTSSVSSVSDSATNQNLLEANANRCGFTIFNDSTQLLYVKFGSTATSSSYSVRMGAFDFYEMKGPGVYTGAVDGIWAADSTGSARVTEW